MYQTHCHVGVNSYLPIKNSKNGRAENCEKVFTQDFFDSEKVYDFLDDDYYFLTKEARCRLKINAKKYFIHSSISPHVK